MFNLEYSIIDINLRIHVAKSIDAILKSINVNVTLIQPVSRYWCEPNGESNQLSVQTDRVGDAIIVVVFESVGVCRAVRHTFELHPASGS
jgi:hypothetical protein